jgi:hypothetical protein
MTTNDIEDARRTYAAFMSTLKWVVPVIAVIVLFVMTLVAG